MAAPALLSVKDLALSYGGQRLLDGVTFAISAGEKAGIVGRNGCGKSSLLRILAGRELADAGDISLRKDVRVGILPQESDLNPEWSVRQCILDGVGDITSWIARYEEGLGSDAELAELQRHIEAADGWNIDSRVKSLCTALGTPDLDECARDLSGGERRRVALCRALVSRPDLLLLDEPTNHLDSETIRWLEDFLKNYAGALLFVTHDRYFLDTIATRVLEISEGRAWSHAGNYTAYLEASAQRRQVAEQNERRRQRFLRIELEWVRAGVKARTTKSKHRLESFYKIEGQAAPPEEREMDLLLPPPAPLGDLAIEMENAGLKLPDGRWLFQNVNLSVKPGEITGIVGRNGAGKTSLLRVCLGQTQLSEGKIAVGKRVAFNYIDQARMALDDAKSVLQEVSDQDDVVFFGEQRLGARSYLKRFLFPDDRVNERVGNLSGGERARLMLAKTLRTGGNVIILDEPTNDLDLPSLRMLEEALASFDGSALVVSHDRYFLDRICDQIVAFEDDGIFVQPGNFSYYLEKKGERDARNRRAFGSAATASGPSTPVTKGRKLGYKERLELEGMEDRILAEEDRVATLEALLNDPAFFVTRSEEAAEKIAELEAGRRQVAALYERWAELDQTNPKT